MTRLPKIYDELMEETGITKRNPVGNKKFDFLPLLKPSCTQSGGRLIIFLHSLPNSAFAFAQIAFFFPPFPPFLCIILRTSSSYSSIFGPLSFPMVPFFHEKVPFGAMMLNLRKLIHLRPMFLEPPFSNPSHDGLTYLPEWCVVVGPVACPAPHGSSLPPQPRVQREGARQRHGCADFLNRSRVHVLSSEFQLAMRRDDIALIITPFLGAFFYSAHSLYTYVSKGGGAGHSVQGNRFPQSFSTPVANVRVQLSGWIAFVRLGLGG